MDGYFAGSACRVATTNLHAPHRMSAASWSLPLSAGIRANSIGCTVPQFGHRRKAPTRVALCPPYVYHASYFAVTIAVTSTSMIISGNASAPTPIKVLVGKTTSPQVSLTHWPSVSR